MRQITLYGTKDKLWGLYDSLLSAGVTPRPRLLDGGQCLLMFVKEISIEEAEAILSDDMCRRG